ncbi:hypothetical protein FB567DRAFT_581389 [Paraphoma chrysanthemicola]|uniref:Uncharacterized protein n=1 Tax=Paraphoma chrysanthemicola TaxID=798071 RepID=A0A8K0VXL1_9PLEO|nr:hypothetical protein FB567DRAFT_581389 [Paraphoma chrysanthemicola]
MASLPKWVRRYHEDIKVYGPLPQGWSVSGAVNTCWYKSPAGQNFRTDHPSSREGRAKHPDYVSVTDNRTSFPGIPQPPIKIPTEHFNWIRCRSPVDALTKALSDQINDITEAEVQKDVDNCYSSPLLYHPADRDLLVFDMEPELASVARRYKRNLIILSPRVEDENQWDHIWDTTSKIPILWRWSTGEQDDLKPIVLGCLPDYGKASERKGRWYIIKPADSDKTEWEQLWCRPKWSDWFRSCGWPHDLSFEDFAWVMVAAQRSISLGSSIADDDIGEWVVQYGRRLRVNLNGTGARDMRENRIAERFVFDPSKKKRYGGPALSFDSLTADIMMYKAGTAPRAFAEQWDRAILAMYEYKASRNLFGGRSEWRELIPYLEDVSALSTEGNSRHEGSQSDARVVLEEGQGTRDKGR